MHTQNRGNQNEVKRCALNGTKSPDSPKVTNSGGVCDGPRFDQSRIRTNHSNVCYLVESRLGHYVCRFTTLERVRTDKSDNCACARMRDMRLDESWTGRIWDHHGGTD